MSTFDIKTLTEDADSHKHNLVKESKRIVEKWDKTGLLKGLNDNKAQPAKSNMARLLENQAMELLKEASTDSNVKGFMNVAFPIVRRVFGGLIANELVSVQPMSLPNGLLFYLDYTFSNANKAGNQNFDWTSGGSVYGDQTTAGNPQPGNYNQNLGTGGPYYLNSSYSQRELTASFNVAASGTASWAQVNYDFELSASVAANNIQFVDVMFTSSTVTSASLDSTNYKNFGLSGSDASWWPSVLAIYKRHNTYTVPGTVRVFLSGNGTLPAVGTGVTGSYVTKTSITESSGVTMSPVFESDFKTDMIPEIDIKVSSVSVTAEPRKLKAKWTPELAQDLNAYQNLDAEVELTQILSEQIAIDIDREILAQLLNEGTGAVMYWSRKPGTFLHKLTGTAVAGGSFTGTVREWYETLVETCIDVANTIHRKTLRGSANFMVVSPDVATIFESTVLYKPSLSLDPKTTQFTMGIEKVGSLTNRFTVYKDPYFPRNMILIGYKGGAFLETGFVYAPYVPLIVTPTIFAPDDFTPRKGVMTRYAKRMVRSDFYGKVIIQDMDVI